VQKAARHVNRRALICAQIKGTTARRSRRKASATPTRQMNPPLGLFAFVAARSRMNNFPSAVLSEETGNRSYKCGVCHV